jgi:hypothetical protein
MQWLNWIIQPRTVAYTPFDLLLISLATMYAVVVITTKAGPLSVFKRLRKRYPDPSGLWHCIWCLAPWMGLVLFLLYNFLPAAIWVLAIAGAALAIRTYTGAANG